MKRRGSEPIREVVARVGHRAQPLQALAAAAHQNGLQQSNGIACNHSRPKRRAQIEYQKMVRDEADIACTPAAHTVRRDWVSGNSSSCMPPSSEARLLPGGYQEFLQHSSRQCTPRQRGPGAHDATRRRRAFTPSLYDIPLTDGQSVLPGALLIIICAAGAKERSRYTVGRTGGSWYGEHLSDFPRLLQSRLHQWRVL